MVASGANVKTTPSRAVDHGLDFASIGMTVTGLRAFNVI
jgi:hypothetical protein